MRNFILFYKLHSLKIPQNVKFGFDNDGNQSVLCHERQNRFEGGSRWFVVALKTKI